MKNLKLVLVAVCLVAFASCKNDDNGNVNTSTFANIETDILKTWEISLFSEDNVDETSNFESAEFEFMADGSVVASNDLISEVGTWSYEDASNDSSDDDGIENDEELILTFPVGSIFEDLTEDWHITSASSSEIVLYDISGNGTTDLLTFVAIL